ncbi:MAG TPA: caspase family protein, partial [Planctomycetaceae bacterium]|nr:caspase family protein [Planctomycetaceae bacterium]
TIEAGLGKALRPPLLDAEATKAHILEALFQLGQSVPGKSPVLIYLSGHGTRLNQGWYFCPHDFDGRQVEATALSGKELRAAMVPLYAKQCDVLVILDSCHAGEFVKECEDDFRSLDNAESGSLIVMASCAPTQESFGSDRHSLFTDKLISALEPAADINDRQFGLLPVADIWITLNEVKRNLSRNIRRAISRKPKLPGIARVEQEFLIDWSLSATDHNVLMHYQKNKFDGVLVDRNLDFMHFAAPDLPVSTNSASILGTWVSTRRLVVPAEDPTQPPVELADSDGQPLLEVLLLEFDGKGNYFAKSQIGKSAPISTAGRYEFEPGGPFRLVYGNGADVLGLKSLTTEELVVEFFSRAEYFGPDAPKPETIVFIPYQLGE